MGDKEYMQSNHRTRLYSDNVSWDGGNSSVPFNWSSMIDIEFYLSKIRIEQQYKLLTVIGLLSVFGGLMSTFAIIFSTIGTNINL